MDVMANSGNLATEDLLEMYRKMFLIRKVEERLGEDWKGGELPGPVHLYIGQEAVAVGVCAHLFDSDWITSTHRGHGHFIAKGGDPKKMMAEVYGRSSGICKGMGGSMHVADYSRGIIGANGIVGGGIGLSVGAALASQLDGRGGVGVCFFGDGAANQGVLAEALNIASLWKLPLILVCENNGFSEFSPTNTVTAGNISDRGVPYGVPSVAIDGNKILEVWQATHSAVRRARAGEGASLIECKTYRQRGHVEAEGTFLPQAYRSEAEIEEWKARDPIPEFAAYLTDNGIAEAVDMEQVRLEVERVVAKAVAFALESPWPPEQQATQYMFA